MDGHIQKLDQEKGYGFIMGLNRKQYFFHRSALKNTHISRLEIGQAVSFEDAESDKGLRAEDIYV